MSPLRTAAPCGRPAHRLGDCAGRSPGSRVVTCRPAFPVSQWPCSDGARRSQLRGQPRIRPMRLPCSLLPPRSLGEPVRRSNPTRGSESQAVAQRSVTERGQPGGRPPDALRDDARECRSISHSYSAIKIAVEMRYVFKCVHPSWREARRRRQHLCRPSCRALMWRHARCGGAVCSS